MRRLLLLTPMLVATLACPGEKKENAGGIPVDTTLVAAMALPETTPGDLSSVRSAIPEAAPDTFGADTTTPARATRVSSRGGDVETSSVVVAAPAALIDAVERERSLSRFCFTEFGKKTDPALRGTVTMLVTVSDDVVSEARVGSSRWSGDAGDAVDRCLEERADRAWKLSPGSVKPGRYTVRLTFTG